MCFLITRVVVDVKLTKHRPETISLHIADVYDNDLQHSPTHDTPLQATYLTSDEYLPSLTAGTIAASKATCPVRSA